MRDKFFALCLLIRRFIDRRYAIRIRFAQAQTTIAMKPLHSTNPLSAGATHLTTRFDWVRQYSVTHHAEAACNRPTERSNLTFWHNAVC